VVGLLSSRPIQNTARCSPVKPANQLSRKSLLVPVLPAACSHARFGIADRMRRAGQRHLLHGPRDQAHRILVFTVARLHLIALDGATVAVDHAAHCDQRQRMTVRRQVLIHLRDLHRREVECTNQQRRTRD
jgi:hypothetical protein